jgi:hypothetical protein
MVFFFRVLMLRRKASPTETELRNECSHMVKEALEMVLIERHPEDRSKAPSVSIYAGAYPPSV